MALNIKKVTPFRLMFFFVLLLSCYAIFLFAKRVIFPDVAFDTINYHFSLGQAGVKDFPKIFKASEFFPLGMHSFNPLIDAINYLVYQAVGYRLGTIMSLLSLIGVFVLAIRIVFMVAGTRLSLFAVLFLLPALIVNEGLFQIATYFTDNIYAFLVLLYLDILLNFEKFTRTIRSFFVCMIALGLVAGLLSTKLTNAIYMLPLFAATIYLVGNAIRSPRNGGQSRFMILALFVYLILFAVLPGYYFFDAFQRTGNPLFPYYNSIFHSPFFPSTSWKFNFGPTSLLQKLFYPYFVLLNPSLLGEVKDFFPDIKLITTFIFTLACTAFLFYRRTNFNKKELLLLFVVFISYAIWQVTFGYTRYAIALEYLLGLLSIILVNRIIVYNSFFKLLVIAYFLIVSFQSVNILKFNKKYDTIENEGFSNMLSSLTLTI